MAFGHGGAREGAGGPPGPRAPKTDEQKGYEYWRARKEQASALAAERENAIAEGKLLSSDHVAAAAATAMATFVQHARAMADVLEAEHGLSPEVAQAVGDSIDQALAALATDLQALATMAAPT